MIPRLIEVAERVFRPCRSPWLSLTDTTSNNWVEAQGWTIWDVTGILETIPISRWDPRQASETVLVDELC